MHFHLHHLWFVTLAKHEGRAFALGGGLIETLNGLGRSYIYIVRSVSIIESIYSIKAHSMPRPHEPLWMHRHVWWRASCTHTNAVASQVASLHLHLSNHQTCSGLSTLAKGLQRRVEAPPPLSPLLRRHHLLPSPALTQARTDTTWSLQHVTPL